MGEQPDNDTTSRSPRGGARARENEPAPLWLGLLCTAVGVATIVAFMEQSLPAAAFGLLFILLGVALTLTSITAARNRRPRTAEGRPVPVAVFTRSPMRILLDLVLAPVGALAFFAVAVAMPFGPIGSVLFGFFGLVMLLGAAVTVRRGVRRRVVEVGPDGIWTPELPRRLAWSEIDKVEAEASVGSAGEAGLAVYHRLGIWPADRSIAAAAPGRGAASLVRGFASVANQLAWATGRETSVGLSDPAAMAPFGINAYEIEQDFDELLRAVGRYLPVAGVEGATGVPDGTPDLRVKPRLVPPAPPLDGMAGAILDEYAGAAARPGPLPRRRTPRQAMANIDAPPPDPAPSAPEPAHPGRVEPPS
jgi:hypothetical protein